MLTLMKSTRDLTDAYKTFHSNIANRLFFTCTGCSQGQTIYCHTKQCAIHLRRLILRSIASNQNGTKTKQNKKWTSKGWKNHKYVKTEQRIRSCWSNKDIEEGNVLKVEDKWKRKYDIKTYIDSQKLKASADPQRSLRSTLFPLQSAHHTPWLHIQTQPTVDPVMCWCSIKRKSVNKWATKFRLCCLRSLLYIAMKA